MRRRFGLVLGTGWIVALGFGIGRPVSEAVRGLPLIGVGPAARADIEGGDPSWQHVLLSIATTFAGESDVLLLVRDPQRQHEFLFYRAAYVLYPLRPLYLPVDTALPRGRTVRLPVDAALAEAIAGRHIQAVVFHDRTQPPASRAFRVRELKGTMVLLDEQPLATPDDSFLRARTNAPFPGGWFLGAAFLVAAGWGFLALAGGWGTGGLPVATRVALAFVAGAGITMAVMLALSVAGIRWSLPAVLAAWGLALGAAWKAGRAGRPAGDAPARIPEPPLGTADVAGLLLVLLACIVNVTLAARPLSAWSNWDAWAVWDIKARAMWHARGIPFAMLRDPLYAFSHRDYPMGMPSLQGWFSLWTGGPDARCNRGMYPLWHLTLTVLLVQLIRDLGMVRGAWLAAGAFGLIPRVLVQGYSGYVDLAQAACMVAALLALHRALRGTIPAWTLGVAGGAAALVKNEGLLWAGSCFAVLAGVMLVRKASWRPVVAAGLVLAAFAGPWKGVTKALHLAPKDYVVDPGKMLDVLPDRTPVILEAVWHETLGAGLTAGSFGGQEPFSPAAWLAHLRDAWLLLWPVVAAGFLLGGLQPFRPPRWEATLVLALQAAAYGAVYLATVRELGWLLLTSLDRLLLQLAPVAFALGVSLLGAPPPPAAGVTPAGRTPPGNR